MSAPGREAPTAPRAPATRGAGLGGAGGVAALTLVSRLLGFARWIVQATTVGAGTVAGAYATANQVPNVLYEVVVGGALAATVVPLLAAPIRSGRVSETSRTASGLLGVALAILVPLGAVLALLAGPIAGLFPVSRGVDPVLQRELVASFLRMFALQVPLYGIGVVLTGVLQAHGRFTWPALTPIASSAVVMATYLVYGLMSHDGGGAEPAALRVLGWGTTLGVAALSLPLLWPAHRLGVRLRPSLHLEGAVARRALRLGAAGLGSLVAQQVSVLTILALARSGGTTGTVAVYQYTQAVYVLPYAVMVVPVATVLYPRLAAAFAGSGAPGTAAGTAGTGSQERAGATELAARSTALVTATAIAGAVALLAASDGAERFFGLLTDVSGMGTALALLAPGLVGYALIFHGTRVLFSTDRAREAAWATAAGWLVSALVAWGAVRILAPHGGDSRATLIGLSIGTSAGMALAGTALLVALARRLGAGALRQTVRVSAACAPAALAVGLAGHWCSARPASPVLGAAIALAAAAACAALTMAAAHGADRGLIGVLRSEPTGAGTGGAPS